MLNPEWTKVNNFLSKREITFLMELEEFGYEKLEGQHIPPQIFLLVEKVYKHLGKRYKLSTAKFLKNTKDEGSYKFHKDNEEEDNTIREDVQFTVLFYLTTAKDNGLLIKDYNNQIHKIEIEEGLCVLLNGNVPHKAMNFNSGIHRPFIKLTFGKEE